MTQMPDTRNKYKCPTHTDQLKPSIPHDAKVRCRQQIQMPHIYQPAQIQYPAWRMSDAADRHKCPTHTGQLKHSTPHGPNIRYKPQIQMPNTYHMYRPAQTQYPAWHKCKIHTTDTDDPYIPASSNPVSRMTRMSDTHNKCKCPTYTGQLKPSTPHGPNV